MLADDQTRDEVRSIREQFQRITSMVRRAFRHFGKGCILVIVGAALSVGVAMVRQRVYISETVILYRQLISTSYLSGDQTQVFSSQNVGRRLQEQLLARPRLEQVIEEFKLYPKIREKFGNIQAVDKMRKDVEFRIGAGDTFHISYRGYTPDIAKEVTAKLAESLIAQEQKGRRRAANATVDFLKTEEIQGKDELKQRELELAVFLAKHPEFAQEQVAGIGPQGTVGAAVRARDQLKRQYNPHVLALERQRARIKTLLTRGGKTGRVVRDEKLVKRLADAQGELAQAEERVRAAKSRGLTNLHPDVSRQTLRVGQIKRRIIELKKLVALSTKVEGGSTIDVDALKTRQRELDSAITKGKTRRTEAIKSTSAATQIVELETRWNLLRREVQEARGRTVQIENRVFRAQLESSAKLSGQASQLEIIDPAFKPTRPSGMGRTATVGAGLAVFSFLAAVMMLGLALLDDRLYDYLDIARLEIGDLLIEVPRLEKKQAKRLRTITKPPKKLKPPKSKKKGK